MERLLTAQEVADLLQIPISTVYQWRYRRIGPEAIRVGRHLRFKPEAVADWLREQERQPR